MNHLLDLLHCTGQLEEFLERLIQGSGTHVTGNNGTEDSTWDMSLESTSSTDNPGDLASGRDPDHLHDHPGEGPQHEAHQPSQQRPVVVTSQARGGHRVLHHGQRETKRQ